MRQLDRWPFGEWGWGWEEATPTYSEENHQAAVLRGYLDLKFGIWTSYAISLDSIADQYSVSLWFHFSSRSDVCESQAMLDSYLWNSTYRFIFRQWPGTRRIQEHPIYPISFPENSQSAEYERANCSSLRFKYSRIANVGWRFHSNFQTKDSLFHCNQRIFRI